MYSHLIKTIILILAFSSTINAHATKESTSENAWFTPMSDSAAQGMGCLVATTSSLAIAYAIGPTELMMLVTGAVIVPSKSSLLFVALGGILGAGACSIGATLTPGVIWASENSPAISEKITDGIKTSLQPKIGRSILRKTGVIPTEPSVVQQMNEDEIKSAGCFLGALGLGSLALVTAPTESVMLAAGGVGLPSSTSLLMMGMLGTLLPAGCSIGAALSLPLVALYQNFDPTALGQKLASIIGWGSPLPIAMYQGEIVKSKHPDSIPSITSAGLEIQ